MSGTNVKLSRTLQPDMSKTVGEQSGSAKSHLDSVQALFGKIEKEYNILSVGVEAMSKSMRILREKIINNPAQLRKYVQDKMLKVQDEAVLSEQQQKHENRTVQQSLTEIKRQNRQTQEGIAKTLAKLKQMQSKVGSY